jgi:hypothetical protein
MTTTSVRAAIRERLDPVIEEIVTREISQRGPAYAQQATVTPALMSILLGQQRPVQEQQPFAALAPLLVSALMTQQQPAPRQQPFAGLVPILISTLLTQQQQPVQRQQPLGALAPFLVAALSGAR